MNPSGAGPAVAQAPKPPSTPRQAPPLDRVERRVVVTSLAMAALIGLGVAAAGALVALGVVLGLAALGLAAAAAWRPVLATYVYLGTLPLIAGIDRGALLPLVRPNEGLLVLLLAGALVGAGVRWCRGTLRPAFRWKPVDGALAGFLALYAVWPLASLVLRGLLPTPAELAATLPMVKLTALYLLVRLTITDELRTRRCMAMVLWPGAVVALIAVLQTVRFAPVVDLLQAWFPLADAEDIGQRGTTTLASPIATGDYVIFCLVFTVTAGMRGLLGRRSRLVLGGVLTAGVLAAGQFSTWISAVVAGVLLLWRAPDLRRGALRFLPLVAVAAAVGAPALVARLEGFGALGVPESWLGRLDNLSTFYLPRFDLLHILLGVSPDAVLPAPETWREVIYLESGYLDLIWRGGLPLLVGFAWFSAVVLRHLRPLTSRLDALGATASTLEIAWWFLLLLTVIDPHLTLRGIGDLLFALLAVTTGRAPDDDTT